MTETVIFRYHLMPESGKTTRTYQFPEGYIVRAVGIAHDAPMVWVEHFNPTRIHAVLAPPLRAVEFKLVDTGQPVPWEWEFAGSVLRTYDWREHMWHVFYHEVDDD